MIGKWQNSVICSVGYSKSRMLEVGRYKVTSYLGRSSVPGRLVLGDIGSVAMVGSGH